MLQLSFVKFTAGSYLLVEGTDSNDRFYIIQTGKVKDVYPNLKNMYAADDGNTEVFYLKDATATFSSFTSEPEVVTF